MVWWHEAKFGLFVHFGLYSIPGNTSEWHMRQLKQSIAEYSKYAQEFNPTNFNADEWAGVARDAGMKYMVIVTKHHDGFALFKSEASSYNMVDATPFKRDIIKELADACPKNNIRFGVYYSLMADWGHPGGGIGCPPWDPAQEGSMEKYFDNIAYPQVQELLTKYGPIAELWFDTDGPERPTADQAARISSLIKRSQPQVIVNDRVIRGDFSVAERKFPAQVNPRNWEGCDLIIEGSWGYWRNYRPQDVKPLSYLIRTLVDVVSKGGNMLYDVGPKPDGTFPQDSIDRLKDIGKWLKVNGESIYGTTASPLDYLPWGRCTRKQSTLYLHVFDWPANGTINVPIANKVSKAYMLGDQNKKPLKVRRKEGQVAISLPRVASDSVDSVIVVQIVGEPVPLHSLALNMPTDASVLAQESKLAVDGDPDTAWQLPKGAPCWLTVDLQSNQTFNTVRIGLGRGNITAYSVDYWSKDHWETIFSGKHLPLDDCVKTFPPITAQKVRFNITEASDELIRLNSFELFNAS